MSDNPLHQLVDTLRTLADAVDSCHRASTADQLRAAVQYLRGVRHALLSATNGDVRAWLVRLLEKSTTWLQGQGTWTREAGGQIESAIDLAGTLAAIRFPARHHDLCHGREDLLQRLNQEGDVVDAARRAEQSVRMLAAAAGDPWYTPGESPSESADPLDQSASEPAGRSRTGPKCKARMTIAQANDKAKKLAHKMRKGFFALSQRQQAEMIGCSWATWKKTEFYRIAETKRPGGKRKRTSTPKTVSLTPLLEAVTGEGDRDEALKQLVAEQEADMEASPLDDDPPDRPRRIHSRKRL
jgi:hypothetical protein